VDDAARRTSTRREWLVLATVTAAVVVVTLDTTILNVAIPTIRAELGTGLVALQWVISGYSLMLGSLLIIGGRLSDRLGTRPVFALGALLFGLGSFLASVSTSVGALVWGEAIIEGVGAALLLPASLATVALTFSAPRRARAFAVWGGAAGAAAALGPVLGGWLTTNWSWRWGFRLNVVVAPVAAVAALVLLPRQRGQSSPPRIDAGGALFAAAGLLLLVFGIIESATYGWIESARSLTLLGWTVWPGSAPISPVEVAIVLSAATLGAFLALERRKERLEAQPLVAIGDFQRTSFRYGLLTAATLVMAQAGTYFVLAVFLQTTHHLSAVGTGGWLLMGGLAVLAGAQIGGTAAGRIGPSRVVRVGVATAGVGILLLALTVTATASFAVVAASLTVFGIGGGLANSQLSNVILSEVPRERMGGASGVTVTNNAVGASLGIAVLGTILRATTENSARWALCGALAIVGIGVLASLAIPSGDELGPSQAHGERRDAIVGTHR
jgi:MFS family permease